MSRRADEVSHKDNKLWPACSALIDRMVVELEWIYYPQSDVRSPLCQQNLTDTTSETDTEAANWQIAIWILVRCKEASLATVQVVNSECSFAKHPEDQGQNIYEMKIK